MNVECIPTAALPEPLRADLRRLLDEAFEHEFSDDDWAHALGGHHFMLRAGDTIVAHASVVARTLVVGPVRLATGYVEAVAVRKDWRGQGHGSTVMRAVNLRIEKAFDLGALCTGKQAFYIRTGWTPWQGATAVLKGSTVIATPEEDDAVMVLRTSRTPPIDLAQTIACDWRTGDVW